MDDITAALKIIETRNAEDDFDFLIISNDTADTFLQTLYGDDSWYVEYSVPGEIWRGRFSKKLVPVRTIYQCEDYISKEAFLQLAKDFLAHGALQPALPGFTVRQTITAEAK